MRMPKIFLALLTVFLISSASAVSAADIASTIRDRYASIKTFQANFTQYLTHRETGQKEKRTGELLFRRPFCIRWDTQAPNAETVVVTDKEVWDFIPDEKLAYRYPKDLVEDSRTLIQVITGQALLSKDFDVEEQGTEGQLQILHLYPKDPVPQLVEAVLYADPVKGYIQRAVVTDFYGNTNDVRFTSFTPNADVSNSSFVFKPGKDVEVEDRIQKKSNVQERTLFN